MRRHQVMMVLAGAAAVGCAVPLAVMAAPASGAVARAGTWRTAIEVPGLGSLNKSGNAELISVSCGSAGNCAAGGFYRDGSGHQQAFVVSERNGSWGRAIEVPGSGTLNGVRIPIESDHLFRSNPIADSGVSDHLAGVGVS